MDPTQYVTIMQAAQLAGVSRRTIYNWLEAGKVEYVRVASGGIRILPNTLFRKPSKEPLLVKVSTENVKK